MRLEGHVTAVEDIGGELKITMQVCEATAPEGTWLRAATLIISDRKGSAHTYYVGRDVVLTLAPRRS